MGAERKIVQNAGFFRGKRHDNEILKVQVLGADFWEVDLDSNFSIFGVRRFSEWPGPLH